MAEITTGFFLFDLDFPGGDLFLYQEYLESVADFLEAKRDSHLAEYDKQRRSRAWEAKRKLEEELGRVLDFNNSGDRDMLRDWFFSTTGWEEGELLSAQMVDHFQETLYKSLFLMLYTYARNMLFEVCQFLKSQNDSLPAFDPGGKDKQNELEVAKVYLREAGVDFPFGRNEWATIDKYRKIRNCIVHCEDTLNGCKNENDIRRFIKDHRDILGIRSLKIGEDEIDKIVILDGFCEQVLKTLSSTRDLLKEKVWAWASRQQKTT
ncbi:MAG: hypothetical protein L0332_10115 [Chloroflexi bacterium]|nr:hypothetical protein [Chloroflexota bacterium]MCI0574907.1 hypothetical protein [Chloroflexota bacterium]MCI0647080.1 hypothetical protein [Chloroflexota bacterium]MCI0727060.1 hypothetical protein [Chloroflexota bacterium]